MKWFLAHWKGIVRSLLFLTFLVGFISLFFLLFGRYASFAMITLMAIGILYSIHTAGEVDPDNENF